jgi:hypothetical protein
MPEKDGNLMKGASVAKQRMVSRASQRLDHGPSRRFGRDDSGKMGQAKMLSQNGSRTGVEFRS